MDRHQNRGIRKVCDCPRRKWPKCPHAWYFNFKARGGQSYRFSLDKHTERHIDSKSEAEEIAADLRKAIRAGAFGQPAPRAAMTLGQLAGAYLERYVKVERSATEAAYVYSLNTIRRAVLPRPTGGRAPLGDWRLADIVTDTIERFREARRTAGASVVAVNRNLATLRAVFAWGIRTGYVEQTPFKRHTEAVVKLSPEVPRSRRLNVGEEQRLLADCGDHLRAVVECALETGMRRGEILSLQWSQVEGMRLTASNVTWAPRAEFVLPAGKTKTKQERRIPISARLKAILEMRRFDPAGEPLASSAYVFGNAIGQPVQGFKRAWNTAVLKAHGSEPTYTRTANLTATSRAALAAIDLHFHDLRREAGSRWLEGGVALHTVRDWLGHTDISQTSTYLVGTAQAQHDAMRQFDERRANLQRIATDADTGGRKRLQTATERESKPHETAVGREPTIM